MTAPLLIISLSLLLVSYFIVLYLIDKRQSKARKSIITPQAFLALCVSFFGLTCLFILFLGIKNALLASALALGILLSLLNPVAAICFFMANLLLRPWEAGTPNIFLGLLPRILAALTFLTWLCHALITTRYNRIVWNTQCWLFVTFLAWLFLSALCSSTQADSLSFFFDNFSPIVVLCFLIMNSLLQPGDLKIFSQTLVVCSIGVISVAIYTTLQVQSFDPRGFRLHGMGLWGNANDLAALAIFMLPLALTPLLFKAQALKISSIIFAFTTSALPLIAVIWSQSRGALSALIVIALSYMAFCRKTKKIVVLAITFTLAMPVLFYVLPERENQDLSISTGSRANYLIAGLQMAKAHPLFGVGINNYAELYEHYTPAFLEWGRRTAHSSWVLVLAEGGVIGLILFVTLYISTLYYAWRMRLELPQFLLLMLGYGVTMSFLSHTYLFLPYVMMAFVLAGARMHLSKSATSPQSKHFRNPWGLRFEQANLKSKFEGLSMPAPVLCLLICFALLPAELRADNLESLQASVGADKPIAHRQAPMFQNLELHGSRAETILFLLQIKGQGCFPISIAFSTPLGNSLSAVFYTMPALVTEYPSFSGAFVGAHLDPLIPISSGQVCMLANELNTWILAELKIGQNLMSGTYYGDVMVGPKNVGLKLRVWKMVMPQKPTLAAYAEMTPWYLVLGHHGRVQEGEEEAELAQAYIAAMNEHRIYPLKSTIGPLKLIGSGAKARLDISSSPSPPSSFRSIVLQHRPAWAYYDFPTVGDSGFQSIDYVKAEDYFRAVENTIVQIGRKDKAIVYLWDEPKAEIQSELIRLSRFVKKFAPSLRQLVTTTYQPELKSSVGIFAPVMDQFDEPNFPRPQIYRTLQKSGKEVWWYISCMSHGCEALADSGVPDMAIDRPSSYVRSIAWLSMKYKLNAFLYYSVNYGFQFFPKRDPWKSLWDFSGNGDGTLFYPGRPGENGLTRHMPIASLRLKLWRESSYDAEYVHWMEALKKKPSWWNSSFSELIRSTKSWSRDYAKYQQLRDRIGNYLDENWQ